jgi:hypothetical protein
MDKYCSSVLLIFIPNSLLTSTPDPTGEKQKHTGKGIAVKHGIDAQAIMMI